MWVVKMGLGQTEIKPAVRGSSPGWRDARLWTGLALMVCSVVVGAKVVGSADDSVAAWTLRADMAPGDVVTPADLVTTRVRFEDAEGAARYFTVDDTLPAQRHLVRAVGAGELLPRSGLGESDPDTSRVSVSVPSTQLPPDVEAGSRVDLWVAPQSAGDRGRASLAVRDVVVLEAPGVSAELVGAGGERQVVLAVPDDGTVLAEVLTASGTGRLMIVGRG